MTVTMVEIAKRTQLSPATVSRVLNGKGVGFISAATRQRVLDAAHEMGYRPNRLARGLVTGRTQVIGVWIRNPDRPYYASIFRRLLENAHSSGYEIIVSPEHDQLPTVSGVTRRDHARPSWPIDGMIAVDCPAAADRFIRMFPAGKCPLVGIGSDYPDGADSIGFDVACGVQQAMDHLLALGRRRIAHLTSRIAIDRVRTGRAGVYEHAVRSNGLKPEMIVGEDESRGRARDAVTAHVRTMGAPDALFCLNDDMAIGACRALCDLGLRVPEDVAVVGCDGIDDVKFLPVSLTTIVQPVDEMCRLAWTTILDRIENPDREVKHVLLRPELRVDASTLMSSHASVGAGVS